jgi:hypothetical protein
MRTAIVFLTAALVVALVGVGCKDKNQGVIVPIPEPFGLTVDSLDITGEVDDPEVTEVDVDGDKWPVTAGEFSGTVDTTAKDDVEIKATDNAGNIGKKTIEIK